MSDQRKIDTLTDDIRAEVRDRVAIITLNRPENRNAMSGPMMKGLEIALREAETAGDVGCIVLTGAGGAFCAGGDVKGMDARGGASKTERKGPGLDEMIHRQRLQQRATAGRIYEMPKPVIASLPGAAAGAGLSLALACDLRIASEKAILVTAFARVGFSGDYGGTFFMTRLIGSAKARELYYLSEKIDAKYAERLGLVNRVVATLALEDETAALANRLAYGPSVAFRYMKENLNRAVAGDMQECMDLEATHHVHTSLTQDHRNAVQAFIEKRDPSFEGR